MLRKGIIFAFLCAALVAASVHAQADPGYASGDVNDFVYALVDRWDALGYLDGLYLLRPYSPEVLRGIAERVLERGGGDDRVHARALLDGLGKPSFGLSPVLRADVVLRDDGTSDYRGQYGAGIRTLLNPGSTIWLRAIMDAVIIDGIHSVLPQGDSPRVDIHDDGSMRFLPAGLSGDAMALLYGMSASTWAGGPRLWGSASFAKPSVGPFFSNGIFIGPQAHAAPNWTLNARAGGFRFSTAIMQLTPSEGGLELRYDKYLAFHSYSFSPIPILDLGIVETAVWGGAFKPLYILPLSMFYYLQSLNRYGDNSLAGLYATIRPMDGLSVKASIYFDDVGFRDLVGFDLDTKIIGAVQGGVAWAPEAGPLVLGTLDYTGVFPYMYAHHYAAGDQDNYTHYGDCLGAGLLPNSDRLELKAYLAPLEGLSMTVTGRLIRHGNASESVAGGGDGGLEDDGWVDYDGDGDLEPSYQEPYPSTTKPEYFRFLTQDVIDTSLQAGVSATWALPIRDSTLKLTGRYLLEYRWNEDLVPGAGGARHYLGLDATWSL